MLKLYAWEPSFSYQILRIRDGEINSLKKAAYLNAASTFLWTCAPLLVALSSFTVYVLMDPNNVLDAQTAFVSLTYFNMLRLPLNFLPALIVYLVQCSVSLKRINAFMNAEELSEDTVTKDTEVPASSIHSTPSLFSGARANCGSQSLLYLGQLKEPAAGHHSESSNWQTSSCGWHGEFLQRFTTMRPP